MVLTDHSFPLRSTLTKAELPEAMEDMISKDTTFIVKYGGCVERRNGGEVIATCSVYQAMVIQTIAAVGGNISNVTEVLENFPKCKFLGLGTWHTI